MKYELKSFTVTPSKESKVNHPKIFDWPRWASRAVRTATAAHSDLGEQATAAIDELLALGIPFDDAKALVFDRINSQVLNTLKDGRGQE